MTDNTAALMAMTTGIVANYVAHNRLAQDDLPALIQSIHGALSTINDPQPEPVEEDISKPTAAQIRRSVSDSGLVSFLDGKTYQSLKRHLTKLGVSPPAYRERFGLNDAYPMVAPSYSARRSEIAKSLGLGQKRNAEPDAPLSKPRKARTPKAS